jgi:hypothetical protein
MSNLNPHKGPPHKGGCQEIQKIKKERERKVKKKKMNL